MKNETEIIREIDLDAVLREKKPGLARWLPRFVTNYLKRTVHQDEINYIIRTFGHLQGTVFIRAVLDFWNIGTDVRWDPGIDPAGRYIFVSNHPLGGLDGLILAAEIEKKMGSVRVVVNDLLMHIAPIRNLFVPVNKYGRQNAEYVRILNEMYESAVPILMFPAGICSRRIDGVVQDREWKKSFIQKSVQYRRDVVPVFFDGDNSRFFHNLARVRERCGIRANVEMIYLPDEMFRKKGSCFDIRFGAPVSHTAFTRDKTAADWAREMRTKAYSLKK